MLIVYSESRQAKNSIRQFPAEYDRRLSLGKKPANHNSSRAFIHISKVGEISDLMN